MAAEADTDRTATLEDARTDVRAAILEAATASVSIVSDPAAEARRLADLVSAYTDLGGDLELPDPDARMVAAELERLRKVAKALELAGDGLALEDFPPRLQDFARAANRVILETKRA